MYINGWIVKSADTYKKEQKDRRSLEGKKTEQAKK